MQSSIYKKDYDLIKTIELQSARNKIGTAPYAEKVERLKILVFKEGRYIIDPGFNMINGGCGNYLLNTAIEKAKNKKVKKQKISDQA